ncbi:MAG: hypothetical protein B0D88_06235, partial [Candidatus Sedimenticola endophacoides]
MRRHPGSVFARLLVFFLSNPNIQGEEHAMDRQTTSRHKFRNLGHTLLLLGVMSLLLALCSRLLLGGELWGWLFFTAGLAILGLPDIPSRWVLRLYNARPLLPSAAPALSGLTRELARRAGLERVPVLYWIPSRTVNAFSVGSRDDAALALTDGLLRLLSPRELAGVLAHEISHVSNNDMRLMGLADMISRPTHLMSVLGLLLMLLSLPLMMFGMAMFPLSGMLLLLAAPGISALLQLGLSRVREFDADLEAARITGDPRGLASALAKATGAVLGQLPAGANSVGAQLVGAVGDGLDAMLAQPAKGYLLMGVEPGYDLWD